MSRAVIVEIIRKNINQEFSSIKKAYVFITEHSIKTYKVKPNMIYTDCDTNRVMTYSLVCSKLRKINCCWFDGGMDSIKIDYKIKCHSAVDPLTLMENQIK